MVADGPNELGYSTEYIGCFKDRGQRDLPKLYKDTLNRTKRADCFAEAKQFGFKYIGHQYGGECWMSNDFGKYGQVPDSQCNMKCHLEPDLKCGGGWRNSVFKVTEFIPQADKVRQAKELNDSVMSIVKDIDIARKDQTEAYILA